MNRRGFLRMLGLAPAAAAAAVLPAVAVAVESTVSIEPSQAFMAIVEENTRRFEERLALELDADPDAHRGPTFDDADALIADLHAA